MIPFFAPFRSVPLLSASLALAALPVLSPVSLHAGQALLIAYIDSKITVDMAKDGPSPADGEPFRMELGHAGILLIADSGTTKYFEYGRYDNQWRGVVRQISLPDLSLDPDGSIRTGSLRPVLKKLSSVSGQGGRIRAAYVTGVDFEAMHAFARRSRESWPDYQWYSNNCTTYADLVLRAGKPRIVPLGTVITVPLNLVTDYVTKGNGEVTYDPQGDKLTLRKPGPWWNSLWE